MITLINLKTQKAGKNNFFELFDLLSSETSTYGIIKYDKKNKILDNIKKFLENDNEFGFFLIFDAIYIYLYSKRDKNNNKIIEYKIYKKEDLNYSKYGYNYFTKSKKIDINKFKEENFTELETKYFNIEEYYNNYLENNNKTPQRSNYRKWFDDNVLNVFIVWNNHYKYEEYKTINAIINNINTDEFINIKEDNKKESLKLWEELKDGYKKEEFFKVLIDNELGNVLKYILDNGGVKLDNISFKNKSGKHILLYTVKQINKGNHKKEDNNIELLNYLIENTSKEEVNKELFGINLKNNIYIGLLPLFLDGNHKLFDKLLSNSIDPFIPTSNKKLPIEIIENSDDKGDLITIANKYILYFLQEEKQNIEPQNINIPNFTKLPELEKKANDITSFLIEKLNIHSNNNILSGAKKYYILKQEINSKGDDNKNIYKDILDIILTGVGNNNYNKEELTGKIMGLIDCIYYTGDQINNNIEDFKADIENSELKRDKKELLKYIENKNIKLKSMCDIKINIGILYLLKYFKDKKVEVLFQDGTIKEGWIFANKEKDNLKIGSDIKNSEIIEINEIKNIKKKE